MPADEESTLPFRKLPAEWKQPDRLDVLFGPVRNKNANAFDWENKLKFWSECIEVHCEHSKQYTFNATRLERAFLHERRTPACLRDVLEDLIHSRSVIPYVEFLQKPETTWGGWATRVFVKRPLSWTYNKMKSTIIAADNASVEYIHVKVVQQAAKKFWSSIPDRLLNVVLEIKELARQMEFEEIESLKILLTQLEREEKVSMKECLHGGKTLLLLRFASAPKALRDIDEQIYVLTKEEEVLQARIGSLEEKIKELHAEAKSHVKQGNKHMARTVLRKKKLQEKSIETLEKNAHNVSTLLHNLEDTAQNHHVFATYKLGIDNLKQQLEKLNIDNVDETMAQLGELVDDANDITGTLGQGLDASAEADLEAELAALMEEDDESNGNLNNSNTAKDKAEDEGNEELKLPSVPNSPTVDDGGDAKTEATQDL